MYWAILIIAGLFEAGFTFCLGMMNQTSGTNEWWAWLFGFIGALVISMIGMTIASHHLPIGTVYPVWTGIGAVGAVLLGIFFFQEPATFGRVFFIVTLIASIIGLKLVS